MLAYCCFGFYQSLAILIWSLSSRGVSLVFPLSLSLPYSFSPFRTRTRLESSDSSLRFSFLFFVFPHRDYSQQAFSSAVLLILVSFYLSIQSLHFQFRLHSSFFLVFNLSSSPSIFSPAAPCNANNLSWGEVNYWSFCCHSLYVEVGRRGRKEATQGGMRVDERNGEYRFVRT